MTILNLIPTLSGGGAERQCSYIANVLAKSGHTIHVGYCQTGPHQFFNQNVHLHRIATTSNYDPALWFKTWSLIRRLKPDLIHSWITQMDIVGGSLALLHGIPWIIREPSSELAYPSSLKNAVRIRLASKASAIVANSKGGEAYWKKNVSGVPITIIPNGLPIAEINGVSPKLPFGIERNHSVPVIIYVGRIVSSKNIRVLLEAIASLKRYYRVNLVVCGEGPGREEMRLYASRLALDDIIYFTGHLDPYSVWSLMKEADAYISLSSYEGCPNTVMEAMAAGCPLLVSDISAHREILNSDSAGLLRERDILDVRDRLLYELNSPDQLKVRAEKAKKMSEAWSVFNAAKAYEALYHSVIVR